MRLLTRTAAVRIAVFVALVTGAAAAAWWTCIRMPGVSHRGPLVALDESGRGLAVNLAADVDSLLAFHPRGVVNQPNLRKAADWLEASLRAAGYHLRRERYALAGHPYENVVAERRGTVRPREIVVVGAHYDAVEDRKLQVTPGANDNATGVAALLALARALADVDTARTLRFVAFANEEPPSFRTEAMGSLVHARRARERGDDVVAMLSLETIGYYTDAPGTQKYPPPLDLFYPDTGNFIAFVGNVASRRLVREAVAGFRRHTRFPSEGAALPEALPGVGWSDHWSFWQAGYPAIMVTDTAPFRYPHYHTLEDTPDKIDFERTARVVAGLEQVLRELAGRPH